MDKISDVYYKWQEYLEELVLRLNSVHDMVDVVSMEFQHEYTGQQVISCLSCIGFCINDIKCDVDKKVVQLIESNGHEKDVNAT